MKQGKRAAIIDYGDDANQAAHQFFADLRELDRQGYDFILIRSMEQKGKGFSVMNRMLKSAGYDVE
jgi:L-threonylcarbamoyladenylate synthase